MPASITSDRTFSRLKRRDDTLVQLEFKQAVVRAAGRLFVEDVE